MPKFTLIAEHDDGTKVTSEFTNDYLDDVLENVDLFLRGVGFFFDGRLNVHTASVDSCCDYSEEREWKHGYEFTRGAAGQPVDFLSETLVSNDELTCPVCNISWTTMANYNCYDKNCPRDKSDAN